MSNVTIQQCRDSLYLIYVGSIYLGRYDLLVAEELEVFYKERGDKVDWIYLEDMSSMNFRREDGR